MTLAIDQHLDVQPVIQVRDLSAIFSNGNGGLHVLDQIFGRASLFVFWDLRAVEKAPCYASWPGCSRLPVGMY